MITDDQVETRKSIFENIHRNNKFAALNKRINPIEFDNKVNIVIDMSNNVLADMSVNVLADMSDNVLADIYDDKIVEVRSTEYTDQYNNTPRRRKLQQIELIKNKAHQIFVKKCNISGMMHDTNLTYDDIVESFLYHKD